MMQGQKNIKWEVVCRLHDTRSWTKTDAAYSRRYFEVLRVRGGALCWGTELKDRRFWGRLPMGSLTLSFRLRYGSGVGSMSNSYLLGLKAVSA